MIALFEFPASRDLTNSSVGHEAGGQSFFVRLGQAWKRMTGDGSPERNMSDQP